MSQGQGTIGSNVGSSVGTSRSRRKWSSATIAAICVASVFALVAKADAYTRNVGTFSSKGTGFEAAEFPGGIATSPDGSRVYLADAGNNRIDEYTADGRQFLRAWGWGVADGEAELQTCRPATEEEAINGEGGERECLAGGKGKPVPGRMNEPVGVAVGDDGTVYVIDRGRGDGRIQAFDPSGEEVTYAGALPARYGATGVGEVSFTYPLPFGNDVVFHSGRVYVADNAESGPRIVSFDVKTGASAEIKVEGLSEILTLSVADDGRIWIGERGGNVQLLAPSGQKLSQSAGPSLSALVAVPGSSNVLVELDPPVGEVTQLVERSATGENLRTFGVARAFPGNEFPGSYGLAINDDLKFPTIEGELPESEPGVVYVVDRYNSSVRIAAEATPLAPLVTGPKLEDPTTAGSVEVGDIGSTAATLTTNLNPRGGDTAAYFEYGTTSAYGSVSPSLPGLDLGGGFLPASASARLTGLQPNTTYHYAVVATNPNGTATSLDATFTTFAFGVPFLLPDGRAYELATPDKGPSNVGGALAARAGDGVLFVSERNPLPESDSGGLYSAYAGLRGATGWRRLAASVPIGSATASNTVIVSPDLSKTVGFSEEALAPGAAPGVSIYLRDNASRTQTLITPYRPGGESVQISPYGVSADFGHILFRSYSRLTPDTPQGASQSLFDYSDGSLENVGVLPGSGTPTTAEIAGSSAPWPVSEDGSKVFFVTEPGPGQAGQLFVRVDDDRTLEISASQRSTADPEAAQQGATFVGATPDGTVAFFTSSARLTDDAVTGSESGEPKDLAPNLYRYELATGRLTDLTVADDPGDAARGAALTGGVLVAADGNSAYFVAEGNLAPGGTTGKLNLYRWIRGGGTAFVAGLRANDPLVGLGGATSQARASDDGSVLAFNSTSALDPAFPNAEGKLSPFESEPSVKEIYRYSAAEDRIACVSCAPAGNGKPVNTEIAARPELSLGYGGNVLSADGRRLFFTTPVALVAEDSNNSNDAYEWENGSAHLISTGTGSAASLVDASASGDDVFFDTADSLVAGDEGGYVDVYDAKVGGGFPAPTPAAPPCEGEACLPPAQAPPPSASSASTSTGAPGNKKVRHRKKHRRHRKHHRRAKHRKQTRSHGHPATGKHG